LHPKTEDSGGRRNHEKDTNKYVILVTAKKDLPMGLMAFV
jgi:hypothetical protein